MYGQLKRKNSNKPMDDFEFGQGYQIGFKGLFFGGTLLAILIWGSSFLLNSITHFQNRKVSADHYLKASSLYDDSRNVDFGGKIQLDFTPVRDSDFAPQSKGLQWIKEADSISNDKGTYLLKEVDSEDKDKARYVIKSIVDDKYENILYDSKTFTYEEKEYEIKDLIASPDLKKALLRTDVTSNWRWSKFAVYWLLDVLSNTIVPILDSTTKFGAASWSPTSENIAYVLENNIFIKNLESGETTQVTFDGGDQKFNGRPDWVYEEEVFSGDLVLWWSHQGDKIAYLKLDDTDVPEYPLQYFADDDYAQYPKESKIKYPKAGFANPNVNVALYDLSTKSEEIVLDFKSEKISIENRIITDVQWFNQSLLVKTTNRASTLLETYLLEGGSEAQLLTTSSFEDGWFEVKQNSFYIPKDVEAGRAHDGYVDTVIVDGYLHLGYYSPPNNPEPVILTKGDFEVVSLSSVNFNTNDVYFSSSAISPIDRSLQSVNLFTKEVKNISKGPGVFGGSYSSGSRYLLLTYAGPEIPYQELVDLKENKVIKTLENNDKLKETLSKYAIPRKTYQIIEFEDEEGNLLKATSAETLPLNFNPKRKYPVLFFVYGGPGSQLVSKSFSVGFDQVVASQLDAIVVTVDGRGTGYNTLNSKLGANYKFIVRDNLGNHEAKDQIAAAKIYAKKPYVDELRIAIWGWSYGGYLTLKTLETDVEDPVFSYGLAVAPVTNWKLYDSIYTERYMRTPKENEDGYKELSVHKADNFKHVNKFFIAHGSGDDNVHMQNTLQLVDKLNQATVENFELMIFPDSDHSIKYHNGNVVVYDRILDFFRRAFRGDFKRV